MNKQINTTDIVNKLKHLKPEKIILFGSYAKGNPDLDSDVDVLVIQKPKNSGGKGFPDVTIRLGKYSAHRSSNRNSGRISASDKPKSILYHPRSTKTR